MRRQIIKSLIFIFTLLGVFQQGSASGIPLEELGIYQDPETKTYVFRHINHCPTEDEMRFAEGFYASARTQFKRYHIDGLADKPDIRRATILALSRAAYYGHPDALGWLWNSLKRDWSGKKKYEDEAARAVGSSRAKNLWKQAKSYQRRGKPIPEDIIPTMEGVEIPRRILEARRKAEEEREEAARAASAARPAEVVLEETHEDPKEDERVPLLRRRPTADHHEGEDLTE